MLIPLLMRSCVSTDVLCTVPYVSSQQQSEVCRVRQLRQIREMRTDQ